MYEPRCYKIIRNPYTHEEHRHEVKPLQPRRKSGDTNRFARLRPLAYRAYMDAGGSWGWVHWIRWSYESRCPVTVFERHTLRLFRALARRVKRGHIVVFWGCGGRRSGVGWHGHALIDVRLHPDKIEHVLQRWKSKDPRRRCFKFSRSMKACRPACLYRPKDGIKACMYIAFHRDDAKVEMIPSHGRPKVIDQALPE